MSEFDQARATVADRADEFKDTVKDVATDISQSATKQVGRVEQAIRNNPVAAAGIAAGLGFVVAMLARR